MTEMTDRSHKLDCLGDENSLNGLSYLVKIWRIDPLNDRLVLLAALERCFDAEGYQDRASLVGSLHWS